MPTVIWKKWWIREVGLHYCIVLTVKLTTIEKLHDNYLTYYGKFNYNQTIINSDNNVYNYTIQYSTIYFSKLFYSGVSYFWRSFPSFFWIVIGTGVLQKYARWLWTPTEITTSTSLSSVKYKRTLIWLK